MEKKSTATDAKKADEKTLGADVKKSQVDVKTSASAMLDPADNTVIESGELKIEGGAPGTSYPTPEALEREAEAKQKLIDDRAADEAKKSEGDEKKPDPVVVTRSALDHGQEAVVHPGAVETQTKK